MSVRMDDAIGRDGGTISLPRRLPPLQLQSSRRLSSARGCFLLHRAVLLPSPSRSHPLLAPSCGVSLARILVRPARSLNIKPLRAADLASRSFLVAAFRHFPPDRARGQSDKRKRHFDQSCYVVAVIVHSRVARVREESRA